MANQLPHDDENLRLALQVDRVHKTGESLGSLRENDSLMEPLLAYKQQRIGAFSIDEDEKQRTWEHVAAAIQSSSMEQAKRFWNRSVFRWTAAAVILVAALFSFIYLRYNQQATLVASAQTSITTTQLKDGSMVTLRPHSKLYLLAYGKSSQRYKLKGEGFFEVVHNAKRTFLVQTTTGKITVLGTTFTASSWGHGMQVYLKEGAVKVESLEGDSSVVLQPGQMATVATKESIPVVRSAVEKEFLDWLDQQMIFTNKPVARIIDELEHAFAVSISVDENVKNKKLTGRLSLENLDMALHDLGIVLGGTFIEKKEDVYTFKAD